MPIVIKKPAADTRTSPAARHAPAQLVSFARRLATLTAADWSIRVDAQLAEFMGLTPPGTTEQLIGGEGGAAGDLNIPWLSHPLGLQRALPDAVVWEMHRIKVEGGYAGWAAMSAQGEQYSANAATPFGALGMCICQALADGKLSIA